MAKSKYNRPTPQQLMEELSSGMKTCRKCGKEKPLDAFKKAQQNVDGLTGECRVCLGLRKAEQEEKKAAKPQEWKDVCVTQRAMAAVNTIAVQKKVSLCELVERVSQVISPETVAEELLGIITQDDNKNAKMRGIECYTRLVIKQDEVDRQLEEDDTDPELLRARIENFIAKNGIKSPQELIETIRGKDTGTTESDPTE